MVFVDNLSEEERKHALSYEWTNYPAALFEPNENVTNGYVKM